MSDQFITLAPRPWLAHANAVVYVDHGCRRTICHITGAEFTRKAMQDHARFIAHACNCHADLVAALRDLLGDRPDVQERNGRFVTHWHRPMRRPCPFPVDAPDHPCVIVA